ncbi:hypothetical protein V2J09_012632 [Rumex salicifolius]
MMKSKVGCFAVFAVVLVAAALLGGAQEAEAVTCDVMELMPCLSAFTSSSPPSATCCAKLKEQDPCLCQYAKNPSYGEYVSSPQAKKVIATCQVTLKC